MSLADELSRLYAQATRGDAMQSDLEALEREMWPHAPLLIAALRLAEKVSESADYPSHWGEALDAYQDARKASQ